MSAAAATRITQDEFERRVLARQLELLSAPTRGAVVGTPLWAGAVCWIMSGTFPALGKAPLGASMLWLGAVIAACLACLFMERVYHRALQQAATFDPRAWVWRFTATLALLSATWASLIWVFWQDGNPTNQLSMTIFVFCGVTNGIISRMNKFETFLVGSGLAILVLWAKFCVDTSEVAGIFFVLLPLWFLAMSLNVRVASRHVRKNIATMIENEALTEALAKARDDADRQREAAERANELKSAFLANMSHELRTPMNAILGFSEIIAQQALGPNAQGRYREYAGDIQSSGKHLLSLINDLLDVAKIEAGKMKLEACWFDGAAAVAHAAHLMEDRAATKGLALDVTLEAGEVYADERALSQIILNLLSNAVKYTDRGRIKVELKKESSGALLVIEDTGCGIPPEKLERVFESFEQVDNRYTRANGGTGLGLTLVRALAELHGGTCCIASAQGEGTRVEVRFPYPQSITLTETAPEASAA